MFIAEKLKQSTALVVAALFLLASTLAIMPMRTASAYTILGDREIRMSTSEGGATGATYLADFDLSTTGDLGGIVITFCEDTPIIGDTSCTEATGLEVSATFDNADAGTHDLSGWTASVDSHLNAGASNNTFTLSNATPIAVNDGDNISFELTGVNNPNDEGSFYARIMTYESEAEANGYTLADPEAGGPLVDAGGIAMSTAELITVHAKVQERIIFCVYVTDVAPNYDETDCNAVTDPVMLGDINGVLDSINPSISKDAKFNITTNASTGVTVRMTGTTLETGPSFRIEPVGDVTPGDGVAVASDEGTEQFGLCIYRDTGGGVTGLTPEAPYDDGNCAGTDDGQGANNDNGALFAFNESEITSLYGDTVATKTAGDWSTGVIVLLGNVSNTTEPGIYTTTLDFIATGRY